MDFSLFPRDLFAEVERLQRELQQSFNVSPSIRGVARGTFPPVNVAATAESAEIYAFAPGLDPKSINVQIERGVLSISGERAPDLPSIHRVLGGILFTCYLAARRALTEKDFGRLGAGAKSTIQQVLSLPEPPLVRVAPHPSSRISRSS